MKRQQAQRCCGKRRYATEQAAFRDLARIAAVSDEAKVPVRAYRCHHGWWHLTSQSIDEHRDRVMGRDVEAPLEKAAKENA